jgi:hypothetical protein
VTQSILWRRLDTPGHDACRLDQTADGWLLQGTAVFLEQGEPARLSYEVACDAAWRSQRGRVEGWMGARSVRFDVGRASNSEWTLNGVAVPGLEGCVDLDLGFTPATNLLQLRRLALAVGQGADAPAAWLDVAKGGLALLPQRYERRGEEAYWYAAPKFGYAAMLQVRPDGFVRQYPGLWMEEQ